MARAKNLFEKARKEAEESTSDKGTGGAVTIRDLHLLAAIKTVTKALETVAETVEADVKATMTDEFIRRGSESHHQPANFEGREKSARASCQLRKRSPKSKLQSEEIEVLRQHQISTEKIVDKKEAFIINPKYSNDQELLAKINSKLNEIPDLPDDFITMQTEVASVATTDCSIEEVFAKFKDAATIRTLLQIVATPALTIRIDKNGGDIKEAIQIVSEVLGKR